MGDTFVVSDKFVGNCLKLFDETMQLKAQKVETKYSSLGHAGKRVWLGGDYRLQELKNNPVFLITEDDLKQASVLNESVTPSKKEKKEAERRKKPTGVFRPPWGETCF